MPWRRESSSMQRPWRLSRLVLKPPPAVVLMQDETSYLAEISVERALATGIDTADVAGTEELAPPTISEVKRAIDCAKAAVEARQTGSGPKAAYDLDGVAAAVRLLQEGRDKIEALGFSAENLDEAVTAFETFGRAVTKIVQQCPTKEDDELLDELEPKAFILEFLLDIYKRKSKFRSRVSALLTRLLSFDTWRSVAKSNPSLQAGVQDLVVDLDAPQTAAKQARNPASDLKRAAMNAASSRAAGVVYVRIIACHNLINTDSAGCLDPYVRVAVEGRTKQTAVINDNLNPCWDAAPFLFEVSSIFKAVRIDVMGRDFMKSAALGHLEIVVAKFPTAVTRPTRHRLNGVNHGEIEMEMVFARAASAASDGGNSKVIPSSVIPKGKTAAGSAGGLSVDPWSGRLDPYPGVSVQMSPKMLQRTIRGSRAAHVIKGKDWPLTGDTSGMEVGELELSSDPAVKIDPKEALGQGLSPSANRCMEKLDDLIVSALVTQQWVTWLLVEPRTSNLHSTLQRLLASLKLYDRLAWIPLTWARLFTMPKIVLGISVACRLIRSRSLPW